MMKPISLACHLSISLSLSLSKRAHNFIIIHQVAKETLVEVGLWEAS
jgi:hypothetical protein